MGAYSPPAAFTAAMEEEVMARIVRPTLAAMARRGAAFRGVLFCGLMLTEAGPKLIEFNVRFGDPECQALLLRAEGDMLATLAACARGELDTATIRLRDEASVVIVMAARGYPGAYAKGSVIEGLEDAAALPGARVFHAGTREEGGRVLADGGRVLGIGAVGATVGEARARAYAAVDAVRWPEGFCRRDIAARA
jgi:phosphoribosylamine--glycine ligase